VSLALLIQLGGQYPSLNKILASQAFDAGRQLIEAAGREDLIAIWKYADRPEMLTGFSMASSIPSNLRASPKRTCIMLSSRCWGRMQKWIAARPSSCFHQAAVSNTPVYAISLAERLKRATDVLGSEAPSAHIDWKRAEKNLGEIARASGGRLYSPTTSVDLLAI
jgi:hypothetical protein